MAKPKVQTRVDDGTKDDIEAFAEENDMTKSAAIRKLLWSGLEHEQRAMPDGGEVLDRVQSLEASQRQEERQQAYQNALTGAALIAALAIVSGYNNPLVLALGGLSGTALVATSLLPLVGDSDE